MDAKVVEYREKNPNCKYCKYYIEISYCNAKQECIWFSRWKAKKCKLFKAAGGGGE